METRKTTLQGRTLTGLLAGAIGGLVSWLLIEKTGWFNQVLDNADGIVVGSKTYWLQITLGGVFGLVTAVSLAVAASLASVRSPDPLRKVVLGGIAGLIGGALGMILGQWVYMRMTSGGSDVAPGPTTQQLIVGVLARAFGWALIGLAVGAAQGITRGSWRSARLGAIGGFMGGLAGGGVFEALEDLASNPVAARLAGFTFVGAAIGFFLEMIPYLMKQAWIKIESGKGAGNEFLLDKTWTTIGRSELADIPLYGNREIAPVHCMIEVTPQSALLHPAAHLADRSSRKIAGVMVHGSAAIADTPLVGGEAIEIADWVLRFHMRAVTAGASPIKQVPEPAANIDKKVAPSAKLPIAAYDPVKRASALRPAEVGQVASRQRVATDGFTGDRLVCVSGAYTGQVYPLGVMRQITLGRSSDQDIPLSTDLAISRNHAVLRLASGRHHLEDLKSANGTFLNEVQIAPYDAKLLKPGDLIRLGGSVLRYE